MRCRTAERLLYLHREGERSPAGERRLNRHLQNCPACGAEARRIGDALDTVERLKDPVPATADPEALTGSILTRIRYLEGGVRARSGSRPASPFGHRSFGTRFQPIAAAAVILLAVGILTEGFLILDRIALLERRMEAVSTAAGTSPVMVSVAELDRGFRRLRELETGTGISLAVGHPADEWIVIRRADLQALLARYGRTAQAFERFLDMLARQVPDLHRITLEDGLDRNELQILLQHSPEIIRAARGL